MKIEQLCKEGIETWQKCPSIPSLTPHFIEQIDKNKNEVQMRNMMEKVKPFMENFPKQKRAQRIWRKHGQTFLQDIMQKDEMFLMKEMEKEDSEAFYQITCQFIKDARAFDESLSLEDIGQALRNVWIIVILQRIFGEKVIYHKAMFAYSMLYPYSDNYIDDEHIPKAQKKEFNLWFTKRLKNLPVPVHNHHEQQISDLISMIESQFPRKEYPQVYESLLAIQEAQVLSLSQQDGKRDLNSDELTYISFRKGGTSVVADGCLIHGSLNDMQIQFCMEYGFMLQIGDDLQDGKEDALHHHQTLVSTILENGLDDILYKLIQYTKDILSPRDVCKNQALLDFVCNDCLMLLFLAVMQNESYYTSTTYQEILACMPVTKPFMEEMQANLKWDMKQEELLKRIDCLLEDTEFDKGYA